MRDMSYVPPVLIAAQTLYLPRRANNAVNNSAAAILIDIMLTCAFLFSKQFQYTITTVGLTAIDRKRKRKRKQQLAFDCILMSFFVSVCSLCYIVSLFLLERPFK